MKNQEQTGCPTPLRACRKTTCLLSLCASKPTQRKVTRRLANMGRRTALVREALHAEDVYKATRVTSSALSLRARKTQSWSRVAEEVRRVAEEVRRQPCGVTVDKDNNLRPYRQDKAKSGVAELQTEFCDSVGSTLTAARPNKVYGDTFPYRIRYLVPRECFRLMDVDDEDYDRIKNYVKGHRKNGKPMYISESQQYKLAGNSIVVACMEHIFEQLFFPSGRVTEPRQLDIFDII